MRIGIGLPNPIPGTPGPLLTAWARRAEERGFSTLATIDRIAYPSYEPLITLAAAAAVTSKINLLTNILLGPTREPVLLAKEAASVDQISQGRLILGMGVGGREDDFIAVNKLYKQRGRAWDDALELLHAAWQGNLVAGSPKPVTPTPTRDGRVPILIGGTSDEAIERTVRWGIGWTSGGMPAQQAAPFVQRVRDAWKAAGRPGAPYISALQYFALGPDAAEGSRHYILDYYSFLPFAPQMAESLPKTPEALQASLKQFEDLGFDEVYFDPTIANLSQVDQLADAVLS